MANARRGAAKRRRERRLRSWLKHERQTVRIVLAETFQQHAALRGQKTARTTEATHFKSSTMVAKGPELFRQVCLERHVTEDLGSVAADGGQRDGRLADSGSPDGRAGYRSAQDLLLTVSF